MISMDETVAWPRAMLFSSRLPSSIKIVMCPPLYKTHMHRHTHTHTQKICAHTHTHRQAHMKISFHTITQQVYVINIMHILYIPHLGQHELHDFTPEHSEWLRDGQMTSEQDPLEPRM